MFVKSFFRKIGLEKKIKTLISRSGKYGEDLIDLYKKPKPKDSILLGGSGRSGTTWLVDLSIFQEPLLILNTIHARIIFGALLISMLAGCSLSPPLPSSVPPVTPSRPVYKIDTSPIAEGILVPQKVTQLSFNTTGRIQDIYVKMGDTVYAGEALMKLETVSLEANVAYAENALLAAQAELEYQKTHVGTAELVTIASAEVSMAEADLAQARYLLKQATLTAPFYGTVVELQSEIGEIVRPGDEIITMADLKSLQVETLDLDEFSISQISVGQRTVVYIEALDIEVGGNVVTIAPQATLVGKERVYEVIIELDSQPDDLRWGMSVDVKFEEDAQ